MTEGPHIISACADCGVGTITLGEWYMVSDEVWEEAWRGRRKPWHGLPGQEILCISCLEQRLGRTLGRLKALDPTLARAKGEFRFASEKGAEGDDEPIDLPNPLPPRRAIN